MHSTPTHSTPPGTPELRRLLMPPMMLRPRDADEAGFGSVSSLIKASVANVSAAASWTNRWDEGFGPDHARACFGWGSPLLESPATYLPWTQRWPHCS
jgi:hypothetical protein